MCQAWMGVSVARQFPAFGTTWRVSELLPDILRGTHVPWRWAFFNQTRMVVHPDPGNTSLKTPEAARGEPLITSKSSNVVSSVITFTAIDGITRPSHLRATMCSSVWKRFPSQFLGVDVSSIAQKQICHHSPHDNCSECLLHFQQSTETLASEQRLDSQFDLKGQQNHPCHLLN